VPLEKLSPHFSGGSTGVPLKFFRSHEYMVASDAGTYRNMEQCGWRPGRWIAFFWARQRQAVRDVGVEFELRQFARRQYQFDPFFSGDAEMADWARRFARIRPRVILGYASTIARFAGVSGQPGRDDWRDQGRIYDGGETVSPQREVIERVFGCKVYDCYGSQRSAEHRCECPEGKMHVNADFVAIEEDKVEGDGPRPFLLTSLQNLSMPFIRYRQRRLRLSVAGELFRAAITFR